MYTCHGTTTPERGAAAAAAAVVLILLYSTTTTLFVVCFGMELVDCPHIDLCVRYIYVYVLYYTVHMTHTIGGVLTTWSKAMVDRNLPEETSCMSHLTADILSTIELWRR